ncbi:MAG: isochorismatase family protein [Planctomycetota bacterium]|nr:isochorismatase family protein [Planctomycetota bacterium]
MPIMRLDPRRTALLVVDIQEKLLPHMHNGPQVQRQAGRLIDGFGVLELPIVVTEQYRKGLGLTVPELATKLAAPGGGGGGAGEAGRVTTFEKLRFSACIEPVRDQLARLGVRSVVVCGIESHVCVLQTCLDLVDLGYVTLVAADAVGSRQAEDQRWALERMLRAGVTPTTVESALLELLQEAGGPRFKAMLAVIK